MGMTFTLPIRWLLANGKPTNDTLDGAPCVSLLFTTDKIGVGYDRSKAIPTIALVDTGANYPVVDQTLCLGAPVIHKVQSSSVDTDSVQEICEGSFIFESPDKSEYQGYTTRYARMRLRGPYQIILGRSNLRWCRLTYDGPSATASIVISTLP